MTKVTQKEALIKGGMTDSFVNFSGGEEGLVFYADVLVRIAG